MPQTLSFNLVHVIFSTKNRAPLIDDAILPTHHAYIAGTVRELGCVCVRVGGIDNHVHIALRLPPTKVAAKVISEIKTAATAWMKRQGIAHFAWQRGYGLFSVSPADIDAIVHYIDTQKAHHAKRSFEDELRALCRRYHVELDERYVWD
jgi:REP element-mobilizing transposase RayT